MRKRRVGVTARSRLIVGNQATGTPQIDSEIAAPLVSRTPRGTVAAATTECGWKRGDTTTGAKDNRAENRSGEIAERGEKAGLPKMRGGQRADARMRRCLILRQGDEPPETPGPLSLGLDCTEGRKSVKGSLRRQHRPPLTDFLPSEDNTSNDEGKGAYGRGRLMPPVGRQPTRIKASGRPRALRAHEALPHTPPGGQAPLKPPKKWGAYT
jgi:hypothetical protein